jgi:hypothetical protein
MRTWGNWEASKYVHYALAVVVLKGCACPLLVAMPSNATFLIGLLGSVPLSLGPVIALGAILSCFNFLVLFLKSIQEYWP